MSRALPIRASLGGLKPVVGLALMVVALIPAGAADAAPKPPPVQQPDTVTATGTNTYGAVRADVRSGPSGESPSGGAAVGGTVTIHGQVLPAVLSGPVTCLNVSGNTAVVKIDATLQVAGLTFDFGSVKISLQDNGGSGRDLFGVDTGYDPEPSTCSTIGGMAPLDGRAEISDAQPLPTTKAECLSGAFAGFGFKNQGQCVSYVTRLKG